MAHHVSGLGLSPTSMDPRSHITDLFVFGAPDGADRTVLVMDVNPTSPFTADAVDPESVYEFGVDTDGDAVTDIAFQVRFSADGRSATVERDGATLLADAPVGQVTEAGDVRFFAGLRSDPFFADPAGAADGFHWTGTDFFADKNVFAIVLEVPPPAPQVGVWARVLVPHDGELVQGDRAGRPGVDATFNQGDDDKRVWNQQEPARDRELFLDKFTHVFEHAGHPAAEAAALAESVLPDLLTYDHTRPTGFPNGRTLTDDVINMGIAQLTGGAVPSDGLKPHTDLLPAFPYLGEPHSQES